jgi:2'-5' RNA ligase
LSKDRVNIKFLDVWKRRNTIQPKIIEKNWFESHYEWIRGRSQCLTFLIRVQDEEVIQRVRKVQDELTHFSCIDPFPKEYLHITVKGCGFLVESKEYKDDVATENVDQIMVQTQKILQATRKFEVLLFRLNIVQDVVFIEVHDDGKIGLINKELQKIQEIRKMEYDYPEFLPHISIVQFQNTREFSDMIEHLESLRETEFGKFTVDSVELVNANLLGRYPTLKTLNIFRLN